MIVIWRFTGGRTISPDAERRAQKWVAISFYLLAPYVAAEAIEALIEGAAAEISWIGIGLTAGTLVICPWLGRAKQRIGTKLGSRVASGAVVPDRVTVGPDLFPGNPGGHQEGRGAGIWCGASFDLNHNQMAQPGGSNVPPWNKGRKVGQKRALRPQEVWLIRDRLRAEGRVRDLALFNLALDSKLPAGDLVCLQVSDVWYPHRVRQRGRVVLQRTGKPLQFEITTETKAAITEWLSLLGSPMRRQKYLFPSRIHSRSHLSGRQYSRLVYDWVEGAGLDPDAYGTQSLRRTKVLLIVQTTGNLKAAQLLLGHTKIESTARYLTLWRAYAAPFSLSTSQGLCP